MTDDHTGGKGPHDDDPDDLPTIVPGGSGSGANEPMPARDPKQPGPTDSADVTRPSTGATPSSGGTPSPTGPGRTGAGSSRSAPGSSLSTPAATETQFVSKGMVFGGRFEVVDLLGKGGMGAVYRVRDRQIDKREVALKILRSKYSNDPVFRDLFFREIRTAQGFVSEHVVQVRDVGQLDDGQLFLTMDFVEGESLSQVLRREKALVPRHALEIARQMLLGLQSGHEQGFIHRDIKPANVMLAARTPKTESNPFGVQAALLDFGIAGLVEEIDGERAAGTPHYMSPEQVTEQRLDPRSDLFAVGICLYEMISGKRPFQGQTVAEVTGAVLDTDLAPMIENLDGVSKPIKRILRKALQKEREKRFPSAAVFIEAIEGSAAFKAEEGAPKWVAAAAAIFALSTAGTTFGMLEARSEVTALREDNNNLRSRSDRERDVDMELEAKENQITRLEGDRSRLQSEKDLLTSQLQDAQATLRSRDDTIGSLQEQISSMGRQVGERTDERQDAVTAANSTIDVIVADNARLADASNAALLATMRPVQTAELFDRVTSLVVADTFPRDFGELDALRASNSLVDSTAGLGYLESLVDAAKRVAAVGSERDTAARIASIEAAQSELARLRDGTQREYFRVTATDDPDQGWFDVERRSEQEIRAALQDEVAAEVDERLLRLRETGDESITESDELDLEELERRKRIVTRVVNTITANNWRSRVYATLRDESHAARRLRALDATLAHLESRLDEYTRAIEADAAAAAAELVANAVQAPERVATYTAQFGRFAAPHLPDLVEGLAEGFTQRVVAADGSLDMESIRDLPRSLADLAANLSQRAELEQGSGSAVDDLLWVEAARAWYATTADLSTTWHADVLGRRVELDEPGRTQDWRTLLALQFQLGQSDSRLPLRPSESSVYEVRDLEGATIGDFKRYDYAKVEDVTGDGTTTLVRRQRLTESGDYPLQGQQNQSLAFQRPAPWRFARDQDVPIDLRSLDPARILGVESWSPSEEATSRFAGLRQSSQLFRTFVRPNLASTAPEPPGGYPCLVVRSNTDTTMWLHPQLGIVREDVARVSRSLVHLEH